MARRSKNNGGDAAALILAIPVAIVAFFIEHAWLAILLGCIALFAIITVIIAKQRRRAAYLKWYYDRDRRIAELNINHMFDVELTNAIFKAQQEGTTVSIGKANHSFDSFKEAFKLATQSSEIIQGKDALSASNSGRALTATFGIQTTYDPVILRYIGENNGGYAFYVFPETVLAFVEGPEQVVFLAAYKPEALKIMCSSTSVTKSKIVYDKTQYDIRYYDKHCPVRDAEIISSRWEVVNQDGSRSFRGGLKPEHNPLHFNLKYGKVTFSVGGYSMHTIFSRYMPSMTLVAAHEMYKKGLNERTPQKEDATAFTNTIKKIAEEKKAALNAQIVATNKDNVETSRPSEIKIEEKPPVISKPISIDDARYRNRMVANNIIKELNHQYHGKHEFKLYQVRKDRDDWKMQDAGAYTYIADNGVEYCVEFDIRTKTEDGTTHLEFFVWCDNAEQTKKKFDNVIKKNDMTPKGNGYSVILSKDYQNEESAMSKELTEIVKVLFADVAKIQGE